MRKDEVAQRGRHIAVKGAPDEVVPLFEEDRAPAAAREPHRRVDQRLQHAVEIEHRAADDLQHVGGGGLLLQSLLRLVEQPRVLDRDDGLIGEGADDFGVFSRECAGFASVER